MLVQRSSAGPGRSSVARAARQSSVRVQAVQPRGKTPPDQPDPFDRHSSPRDRARESGADAQQRPKHRDRSSMFAAQNRRRGRPAHLRSPDDSPLRDGNRDRLIGLLTERAAKTLLVYLQETNPTVYHWLFCWLKENPIPHTGTWDEISGEAFLRKMLSTPAETAKIELGRGELFDNIASIGVDPRQMAQRIMEIRVQLSKEFTQDLQLISDENSVLLRETLQVSLANTLNKEPIKELPPRDLSNVFVHPELLSQDGTLHPEVATSHPELLPVVESQADRLRPSNAAPSPSPAAAASPSPSPSPSPPRGAAAGATPSPPPPPSPSRSASPPRPISPTSDGSSGGGGGGGGGGMGAGPTSAAPPRLPPSAASSQLSSRSGLVAPSPAASRGARGPGSLAPRATPASAGGATSSSASAAPPPARRPASSGGAPHAVNQQPPTRRVTGPWKFTGLKKQVLEGGKAAGGAGEPPAAGAEGADGGAPGSA